MLANNPRSRATRRLLCVVVSLALLLSTFVFIPLQEVSALTTSEISAKIADVRRSYGNGSYSSGISYEGGSECYAWVNLVTNKVFGEYITTWSDANRWTNYTDFQGKTTLSHLCIGDVVRYNNGSLDHSIFITDIKGDTVYYTDWISSRGVRWDQTMTKTVLLTKIKLRLNGTLGSKYAYGYIMHSTKNSSTSITLPTTSANIPNGVYAIQHKGSGRFLDVTGRSLENGAKIQVWDWANGQNQVWSLERQSDNTYYVRSILSNKMLDVSGASTASKADVQQCGSNGTNAQRWYIIDVGGGYYTFIAKCSGMALDVSGGGNSSNGTKLIQYPRNNTDAQKFKLIIDTTTAPAGFIDVTSQFAGKTISIKFNVNNMFASAELGTSDNPLRARATSSQSWEQFRVVMATDGSMGLLNLKNNQYITVNPNNRPASLNCTAPSLRSWECFRIYKSGSNYYIRSSVNGYWVMADIGATNAPLRASGVRPAGWEAVTIVVK